MKKAVGLFLLIWVCGIEIFISCRKKDNCEACSNNPPLANAGIDRVVTLPIDSVLLNGDSSSDRDGTIITYKWTKIAGPDAFIIIEASAARTIVKQFVAGVYQFELKVTDNTGLFEKDTIQITVIDPGQPNRPSIAEAGADQTIILPVNSVNLDGSGSTDPDNNIASYTWLKITGPASCTIVNENAVQTLVTNLVEGIYQFELTVTDAGGLFTKDTVQVVLMKQAKSCTNCKIVFVSGRDGNDAIYSCNADGSNIQRLTNNAGADNQPAWSPDGTHIAFISDRTGNPELYIMNANGSDVVRKTFSQSFSQNPTWSPDGKKIAYSTLSNGSSNIWVTGAEDGSTPELLFDAPGWDDEPAWSPDGTKIALASDWAAYDFVYDLYTINAHGKEFKSLYGTNIYDNFDYLYPSWSPSSNKLAMAIRQTVDIDQYDTRIGVINADGSGLTILRSGAAAWTKTCWSGDGKRIVYTSLLGSRMDVSWVSADGTDGGIILTDGWDANWQH